MDRTPTKLGQLLAEARKRKGLTQRTLSDRLGYPYNVISKWEYDQAKPTREEWEVLVEILGPELTASEGLLASSLHVSAEQRQPAKRVSRIEPGINKRLRQLRLDAGITAQLVCEQTDILPSALNRIEKGEANPTYQQLRRLMLFFNTTYDYLLDGVKNQEQSFRQVIAERDKLKRENDILRKTVNGLTQG